jgi:filamentous hemagglutinin
MATWKKLLVSGSNISQLVNDAGYLTSVTAQTTFVTASFNGVHLIANDSQGQLNFASSSGEGLTISANAGSDTLTFGLSAVPNASLENSAITIAGSSTSLGGSISAATIGNAGGFFSGSAQVDYLSISNVPSGIVSASSLSSPGQGQVALTINGVAGSTIDLGLETGDSPTFAGVTAGNITVGVTDDQTITTTSGNLTLNATTGLVNVTNDLLVGGNLTVQGDTINANVTNLDIEDRYILLNSGSAVVGDSGIVFGGTNGVAQEGAALIWDASYNGDDGRAAIVNDMASNATGDQTPNYHLAGVFSGSEANAATAQADHLGNIRVEGGDIWIYG